MDIYSPLRYPGGKGKVADYFKKVFKDNYLYDGTYVEPYAGGASVALSLLLNEYASRIIINDIDRSIYAFWHSVLFETDSLCRLIHDTPVNVPNWEIQKKIQKEKQNHDLLTTGFSTFYLNRTNRSGILNAGIIGGKNQLSTWKIDARYNKKDLLNRIKRIARYIDKIEVYNVDAIDLIIRLRNNLPKKSLFYFDPPYYVKGKDLYLNYYKDEDHKRIAHEISKIDGQKWIVTYDDVNQIRDLYTNFKSKTFKLSYSAGNVNKTGQEIMIFSDNLFAPDDAIYA
jgi:DNA adenine methylase